MYLENRQNPRSLEAAGETPVTAGASVLTFDMIQKFWKSKVKELEEVEARGVSAELVQKVSSLRETLKLFPSKAETVADAERRYHNVLATVEQLSKENAIEIVLPERLGKVEGLLKGPVANAWAEADWNTLAESIKEVHASLFHVEKELEKLQLWGLSVDRLALRIRTIMDVESFLEEAHEVVVRDTKNWGRRADFEAEVLQAWAGIDETAYESAKKKLDTALDLREQMLINRIGELITEKSGVLPQETITKLRVFQDNLALKSESRKSSRASGDKRASADSMEDWAPAPRLSGELVEITTETGLRISVDKSLVSHYEKRWSADVEDKQKDDENRPKNPMDGLRKARERYLKTKGG
jgi:hypothetical protein